MNDKKNGNGKKLITILSTLIALGTIIGFCFAANNHYYSVFAKNVELQQLSKNFEFYKDQERLHAIQKRIWQLEDRYGGVDIPQAPQSVVEEYRKLKAEEKLLSEKLTNKG